MLRPIALLAVAATLAAIGCQGSRWARSDPRYRAKYEHHTDNVLKMAKQASDARQVAGRGGVYSGFAVRDEPVAAGGQIGGFVYPPGLKGMVETRFGLAGLIVEGDQPLSGGIDLGARLQSPSRLAPFVGAGVYAGFVPDILATSDGVDNDGNGVVDEPGEDNSTFVGAAYPEVGVHFWATPRWRLTASASHYFTTINDQSDFTLYGISLSWLDIPRAKPKAYRLEKSLASPASEAEDDPVFQSAPQDRWPSTPWSPAVAITPKAGPTEAGPPEESPYAGLAIPISAPTRVAPLLHSGAQDSAE